jgi:hypothetical protein
LGVVSVNIQAWVIARYSGWKFDWLFQAVGIPIMIMIGYFVKFLVGQIWDIRNISVVDAFPPVLAYCIFYSLFVLWSVWLLPWLFGMGKDDVANMTKLLRTKLKLFKFGSGAT